MVLEVAILDVKPALTDRFEADFTKASAIISASPGYRTHELRRCHEVAARYLLLVWWETLEAHTVGFRQSPAYEVWKQLLHHYYDPFPTVEHYVGVES